LEARDMHQRPREGAAAAVLRERVLLGQALEAAVDVEPHVEDRPGEVTGHARAPFGCCPPPAYAAAAGADAGHRRALTARDGNSYPRRAPGGPVIDFGLVDAVDAEAIGEPGRRTFRVRARAGDQYAALWIEKEQLTALGRGISSLLAERSQR